jgi:hypothetical protein
MIYIDKGAPEGDYLTIAHVSIDSVSSTVGKMRITESTVCKINEQIFANNFKKALETARKELLAMVPLIYIQDRILQNYNMGLPYWYRRWVYKYFKWML